MDILSDVKIFGDISTTGGISATRGIWTDGNLVLKQRYAAIGGSEVSFEAEVKFPKLVKFENSLETNSIYLLDYFNSRGGVLKYFDQNTIIICGFDGPCIGGNFCGSVESNGLHSTAFLSAESGVLMKDIDKSGGDNTFRPVINEKTIFVPTDCKSFVIGLIPRNKPPMITSYVKNGCSGSYTFQKVELDILARETEIIGTRDSTDEQTYTFVFGSRTF